jgi:hypothetical protein
MLLTMPPYLRASVLIAAATIVGCSAPVVDDVADANGAMTEGVVVVERTVSADGPTQTNISAKFMRLGTPVDVDLAERVIGSKLDLPAIGTCRPRTDSVVDKERAVGSIELFDVGDVSLRAGDSVMSLAVRAFPDVGDLVSGMFYTSRDTASDLPAAPVYKLESTGSASVDRFSIDAEAPAALEDVRLGGASLLEGAALEEGMPAALEWRAGKGHDVVLVDVSGPSGSSIRCAYADEGKATLPGWVLRGSTLGGLPATATVAIHRVRERSFATSGVDTGAVRFDLAVIGRATVSPVAWASPTKP